MIFSRFAVGLLAFILFHLTEAGLYYIDTDSCKGDAAELVARAMDGALTMANAGLNRVRGTPDSNQNTLLDQLFNNHDKDGSINRVNEVFGGTTGVTSLQQTNDETKIRTGDQIKVYCDTNRLKVRKRDPLHYYDSDVKEAMSIGTKTDCAINLTYTTLANRQNSKAEKRFWQIQICPWYLTYELKQSRETQTTTGISTTLWTKIMTRLGPYIANKVYTPIDFMSAFDKVLLHEITHTSFGRKGSDPQGMGGTKDVGGFSGYGWKNCRKLSTVVTNIGAKVFGGDQNADTWALYGSASYLLDGGKDGQHKYVDDNGQINPLNNAAKRMESAVKGVWNKFVA